MPDYHRSDADCADFVRRGLPHYHIIRLNDDIRTPGRVDRNQEMDYLGFQPGDFEGRSVLDIGALDGVLSFNAERMGASTILAIDVEDTVLYDWGWSGPTADFVGKGQTKNRVFPHLKEFFKSDVSLASSAVGI
jgi:tRNA (mo5U34)-methyltransferase